MEIVCNTIGGPRKRNTLKMSFVNVFKIKVNHIPVPGQISKEKATFFNKKLRIKTFSLVMASYKDWRQAMEYDCCLEMNKETFAREDASFEKFAPGRNSEKQQITFVACMNASGTQH